MRIVYLSSLIALFLGSSCAQTPTKLKPICQLAINAKKPAIYLTDIKGSILKGPIALEDYEYKSTPGRHEFHVPNDYLILITPARIKVDAFTPSSPEVGLALKTSLCENSHTLALDITIPERNKSGEQKFDILPKTFETTLELPLLPDPNEDSGWADITEKSYKFDTRIKLTIISPKSK